MVDHDVNGYWVRGGYDLGDDDYECCFDDEHDVHDAYDGIVIQYYYCCYQNWTLHL